jgi:hypothetical protein
MGLLERVFKWLTYSNSSRTGKGHPDLYPIDVAQLTKELNLIDEAKRLGEAGIPPSDAQTPSGPEAAAIQRVEKARQDYVDWAVVRAGILSQDLSKLCRSQDVNRARQADKEFERKASALLTEKHSLLRSLGEAAKQSTKALEDFKTKHGLTRDATLKSGAQVFFNFALLFFLILVEGALNASFFAQGLDSGLIGGAIQAMILAALNVLVAYCFGRFVVRYLVHRSIALKMLGFIGLACSLVAMCAIGLGIAHFRDALTSEMVDPAQSALETLLNQPFLLRDFFSWALFAISVFFGIAALVDGILSGDLYPGYGAISERKQLAVDDYEDELNELRVELEELKDEELRVIDETLRKSQSDLAVFSTLIDGKRTAHLRLMTALRNADNCLDAVLHNFRTENQVHRKGLARPAYFDMPPALRPLNLPVLETSMDEAELKGHREAVDSFLEEVQDIRGRIQAAFNQQFDVLKKLDTHFPSGRAEQ